MIGKSDAPGHLERQPGELGAARRRPRLFGHDERVHQRRHDEDEPDSQGQGPPERVAGGKRKNNAAATLRK